MKPKTVKWKQHVEVRLNEDGSIDEIVIDNCYIHIEQMSNGHWWIGIGAGRRCGPHKNRKDMMHVNLFNVKDKEIKINSESDDGIISIGFFT